MMGPRVDGLPGRISALGEGEEVRNLPRKRQRKDVLF
jgi:hypothetical protein